MSVTIPTSITGAAQTGFTTPGYTTTAGAYPGANGRQNYVTALSGTQAGVRVHSVSDPFVLYAFQPQNPKGLGAMNANGIYTNVPVNVYGIGVRKGVYPAANQPAALASLDIRVKVPAGSDSYDAANVRAMLSAGIAYLTAISAGLGDTVVSGQL